MKYGYGVDLKRLSKEGTLNRLIRIYKEQELRWPVIIRDYNIQIGCEDHDLVWWLEHGESMLPYQYHLFEWEKNIYKELLRDIVHFNLSNYPDEFDYEICKRVSTFEV